MPIQSQNNRSFSLSDNNSTFEYAYLTIGDGPFDQKDAASNPVDNSTSSNAVGMCTMKKILHITNELSTCIRDRFNPNEGVYRLNDEGEYVSEQDWLNVWNEHPSWWQKAWMLADNGQYTASRVAAMSIAEIERAYDDPSFEPEYAYYTEADESGLL